VEWDDISFEANVKLEAFSHVSEGGSNIHQLATKVFFFSPRAGPFNIASNDYNVTEPVYSNADKMRTKMGAFPE
jgi:hypothetical protein